MLLAQGGEECRVGCFTPKDGRGAPTPRTQHHSPADNDTLKSEVALASSPTPSLNHPPPPPRLPPRCYHRATLYSFARHYETGEPLPEAMFERLKAAKNYRSGTMTLRQVRAAGHAPSGARARAQGPRAGQRGGRGGAPGARLRRGAALAVDAG